MIHNDSKLTDRLRDKLLARALGEAPQWPAALLPAAGPSAGSLLIGTLLDKLPPEDQTALIGGILAEQNADGSWSRAAGGDGDLSLTLEIVQALSAAAQADGRAALARAVPWLEANRRDGTLHEDTLILLGALTEFAPRGWRRAALTLARLLPITRIVPARAARWSASLPRTLKLLAASKERAAGGAGELLQLQLPDGSWDGAARTTMLALVALRYAGIAAGDSAFERGWRFLRSLQYWHGELLLQAADDLSNIYHATAARALLSVGVDREPAAASCLTLLHQARVHGGWAAGGLRSADTISTALALDALSLFGDDPAETAWTRRRAIHFLMRTQNPDGGWPLYPHGMLLRNFRGRADGALSRVDAAAFAVQGIAYSGISDDASELAVQRGLHFLRRRQRPDGLWEGDGGSSAVLTSAWALESLLIPSAEQTARAALHAVGGLLKTQSAEGGWCGNRRGTATVLETAGVLRALNSVSGIPATAMQSARTFIETRLADSGDEAFYDGPYVLPWRHDPVHAPDLAEIWALEALAPTGMQPAQRRSGRAGRRFVPGRRFER